MAQDRDQIVYRVGIDTSDAVKGAQTLSNAFDNLNQKTWDSSEAIDEYSQMVEDTLGNVYKQAVKDIQKVQAAETAYTAVVEANKQSIKGYADAIKAAKSDEKKAHQDVVAAQKQVNLATEQATQQLEKYLSMRDKEKVTQAALQIAYEKLQRDIQVEAQMRNRLADAVQKENAAKANVLAKQEAYSKETKRAAQEELLALNEVMRVEEQASKAAVANAQKQIQAAKDLQDARKQASKEHIDQVQNESDAVKDAADDEGDAAEDAANKQAIAFGIAAKAVDQVVEALKKAAQEAINLAQQVVSIGAEFETSMAQVAATSGMTATDVANQISDYRDLVASAKEAGLTTMFSASQAGEALNYLALAGYNVEQSIETMPDILTIAAAGAMDLGRASDMVTDAMNALDLGIGNTTTFIDKMAKTAQSSNTNVEQLGRAILTVGGTATVLKGGVTELDTALGLMANSGIKASVGGVNLRNILLNLTDPTREAAEEIDRLGLRVFDAEGNMRGLNEIFGDLNDIMADFTDEQRMKSLGTIFNTRQLRAVTALMKDSGEAWDNLAAKIENSNGAAEKMAETMRSNFNGALNIAKSNLEAIAITLYEGVAKNITDLVREAIPKFQELNKVLASPEVQARLKSMSEEIKDIALTLLDKIIAVIPTLVNLLSNVEANCRSLQAAITAIVGIGLITKIPALITALGTLGVTLAANPWMIAIAGATALAIAINEATAAAEAEKKAMVAAIEAENDAWVDQRAAIGDIVDEWNNYKEAAEEANQKVQEQLDSVHALYDEMMMLRNSGQDATLAMEALADSIPGLREQLDEGKISYENIRKAVDDYCDSLEREHELESAKSGYTQAVETKARVEKVLDSQKKATEDSMNDFLEAQEKYREYEKELQERRSNGAFYEDEEYNAKHLAELEAEMEAARNIYASNYDQLVELQQTYDEALDKMEEARVGYVNAINGDTDTQRTIYNDAAMRESAYYAESAQKQSDYYKKMEEATKEHNKWLADSFAAEVEDMKRRISVDEATENDLLRLYQEFFGSHPDWDRYNEDLIKFYTDMNKIKDNQTKAEEKRVADEKKRIEKEEKEKADARKKAEQEYAKSFKEKESDIDWNAKQFKWTKQQILDAYKDLYKSEEEYINAHADVQKSTSRKLQELEKDVADERTKTQEEAAKKYVKAWEKGYDNLLKKATKAYDDLEKKREKFEDNLLKGVELYTTESSKMWNVYTQKYEDDKSMKVSAKNMKEQLKELEDYNKVLDKLRAKGVSDELMSEILGMNPDKGKEFADALNKMSTKELNSYVDAYNKVHEKTDQMTSEYYSKELAKFDQEYMQPLKAYVSGDQSELKKAYETLGQDSVQGYLDGLQEKAQEAEGETKKIYEDAYNSVKEVLGIHSPSTKYYELGEYTIEGFLNGVQSKAEQLANIFLSLGQKAGDAFVNAFKETWDNFVSMWNTMGVTMPQAMIATAYGTPSFVGGQTIYNTSTATNYTGLTRDDVVSAVKEALPSGDVTLTIDQTEFARVSRNALNSLAENSEMGLNV